MLEGGLPCDTLDTGLATERLEDGRDGPERLDGGREDPALDGGRPDCEETDRVEGLLDMGMGGWLLIAYIYCRRRGNGG